MPNEIRHPQWRDQNESTKYPFNQNAELVNDEGDTILASTFLDAMFYPVGGTEQPYISAITLSSQNVTIYLGDSTSRTRASASFDRFDPPDTLRFVDEYNRPAGIAVSEAFRLAAFSNWSTGEHSFSESQTSIVARCYAPSPGVGVRGILLDDGSLLAGDVWFVGDAGVVLSCEEGHGQAVCQDGSPVFPTIRVDIIGDSLHRRKLCQAPGAFEPPQFLQTIAFCKPPRAPIAGTPGGAGAQVEVCFLMPGYEANEPLLTTLQAIFPDMAAALRVARPNVDFRYTLLTYKDFDVQSYHPGYQMEVPFASQTDALFASLLGNVVFSGTSTTGVDQQLAALRSISEYWIHSLGGTDIPDRFVFWFGDRPGREETVGQLYAYPALADVLALLGTASIRLFAINSDTAGNGIDGLDEALTPQATYLVEHLVDDFDRPAGITNEVPQDDETATRAIIETAILTYASTGLPDVPAIDQNCYTCGPGDGGNVKLMAGSSLAADTILRIRPVASGMSVELVGEKLEGIQ